MNQMDAAQAHFETPKQLEPDHPQVGQIRQWLGPRLRATAKAISR